MLHIINKCAGLTKAQNPHIMARSLTKKASEKLTARIIEWVSQQKKNTFNYKQVAYAIGASAPILQREVAQRLVDMALNGDIIEVSPGKYKAPERNAEAIGTFIRRSNGKNAVLTDEDGETINVAERNSLHALNGDRVLVSVAARRRGVEPEAVVVKILEKKEQTFIGKLEVDRQYGILLTDSKYLAADIFIPKSKLKGGRTGDKAIVRITSWPEDAKNPRGEVVDVLGKNGANDTEMHAILAEFGLPYRYPEAVERAAAKIEAGITPEVIASREDMRGVTTFTIDPKDAKDFDDAISFRKLRNGNYEIGVHIADVTHYVMPDTALNREASERATSVYLVDRVVPMLPEHLSNGICSLRPGEEKLTYSCIFEMNSRAEVLRSHISRTVTCSDRRFTYEEAQEVIETGKGDYAEEILTLDHLAKQLRAERYKNGSMEFGRAEVRFDIDDKGRPIGVYFKEMKDANKLIEEFMLLANKTVASFIGNVPKNSKPKAFVYRVHEQPDAGKLQELATMAATFGYKIKTTGTPRQINLSINKMLEAVKGKAEENFLSTLAIRSMAKAIYSTDNIGHYGLGFDYYTHFTSPIRRYPDMMVHRLLTRYMAGGRSVNVEKLEEECKHSSEMEKRASDAERASIKYKQVEYMSERLGEEYAGVITGVTEWGLYVELEENLCEGLVPIRDLADDYYDFDEKNFSLIGRRNGFRYRLGDKVTVKVARTDLAKKQLDFVIAGVDKNRPGMDDLGYTDAMNRVLSGKRPGKKRYGPQRGSRR